MLIIFCAAAEYTIKYDIGLYIDDCSPSAQKNQSSARPLLLSLMRSTLFAEESKSHGVAHGLPNIDDDIRVSQAENTSEINESRNG